MVLYDLVAPLESGQLPGWTGLAVALVMFAALGLLWLSMRRHLKRADYPDEVEVADDPETRTDSVASSPASPGSAPQP